MKAQPQSGERVSVPTAQKLSPLVRLLAFLHLRLIRSLVDHIRPDWEAKLAAVRAAVTRRANRRIVMRQVGDRLVPIGVTSGRVIEAADGVANAEGGENGSGRRRRRIHGGQDINQILGSVGLGGLGGQDLEEVRETLDICTQAKPGAAYGHGSHASFISGARGAAATAEQW
jgi:hypothetical protein